MSKRTPKIQILDQSKKSGQCLYSRSRISKVAPNLVFSFVTELEVCSRCFRRLKLFWSRVPACNAGRFWTGRSHRRPSPKRRPGPSKARKNRAQGFPPWEAGPFCPQNCRIPAPGFLELLKRKGLFGGPILARKRGFRLEIAFSTLLRASLKPRCV